MPELVRWGSVILHVFFNDTGKYRLPHFHVRTPEGRVVVSIADLTVIAGDESVCDMKKVRRWATDNRALLIAEWNRCNPDLPVRSGQ